MSELSCINLLAAWDWVWWFKTLIPALVAEAGGSQVQDQLGSMIDPVSKKQKTLKHLLSRITVELWPHLLPRARLPIEAPLTMVVHTER
jgi:hypothetical protein